MKHLADSISDWWDRLWNDEEVLLESKDLTVLAFTHRLSKRRAVAVVSAVRGQGFSVSFQAYEVENVSLDGWAHLLRILESTPTFGHLIVWLWHQGVSEPAETWQEEML